MALLYGELQGSLKDNRADKAAVRAEPEHPASTGLIDTARRFSMACCILPRPVCSTIRRPKASFTSLSLISHLSPTARSHPTCSAVPPLMRPVPLHLPPRPVLRYKRQSARKGNILQPDRQIDRQTDRQDKGMASEETEFVLVESWTPGGPLRCVQDKFERAAIGQLHIGSISPSKHRSPRHPRVVRQWAIRHG